MPKAGDCANAAKGNYDLSCTVHQLRALKAEGLGHARIRPTGDIDKSARCPGRILWEIHVSAGRLRNNASSLARIGIRTRDHKSPAAPVRAQAGKCGLG